VVKPYFLALAEWYAKENPAMEDLLIRSANEFRPSSIADEVTISNEFRPALDEVEFVIDDYQTNTGTDLSSSGVEVSSNLEELHEILMQDYDGSFQWTGGQWSNGMTRARFTDTPICAVMAWEQEDAFLEYDISSEGADWSTIKDLNFRACQITRHPLNEVLDEPISFTVTLGDVNGNSSSISIAPYGLIAPPYQRSASPSDPGAGWQNEFHSITMSLSDFMVDDSELDLSNIALLRFDFGPSFGSEIGAIGLDDIMLVGLLESTTGVEIAEEMMLKATLHPNPFIDIAHLRIDNPQGNKWAYRIYDVLGKRLIEQENLDGERALLRKSELAPGLYLLEVILDGRNSAIRFQVL
jgi:hypothetical protein